MVTTKLLEFHVVHHCNLKCFRCSHFSPMAPKWSVSLAEFHSDVSLASNVIIPEYVHLLGGEPLLHPNLPDLLIVARKYFPDTVVKVVTNGTRLIKSGSCLRDSLISSNIVVAISVYPPFRHLINCISDYCTSSNIRHEFWPQDTFLDFLNESGNSDPLASRKNCSFEGAFNIRKGIIYPCPVTAWGDFSQLPIKSDNGISLTESEENIDTFLRARYTTSCCRYCKVNPGRISHRFMTKDVCHGIG